MADADRNQGESDAPLEGFVLTQHYRQGAQGVEISFWIRCRQGPLLYRLANQEVLFFVRVRDLDAVRTLLADLPHWRSVELQLSTMASEPVAALYFTHLDAHRQAQERLRQQGLPLYEEDIRPPQRYLMERFILGGIRLQGNAVAQSGGWLAVDGGAARACDYSPRLKVLSLDIETSLRGDELYSIGLSGRDYGVSSEGEPFERVLMRGQGALDDKLEYLADERQLLRALVAQLTAYDPDMLVGWNLINFDLQFLERKSRQLAVPLTLGRRGARLQLRRQGNRTFASLPGRVVVDGIDCLKGATYHFDSYALDHVARALLGRGKNLAGEGPRATEIARLFHEDKPALAAYNLNDCRLVLEIFERADLIHYLLARSQMTGLPLDKVGGSATAFDNLYLPRLHRQGHVAPVYASGRSDLESPGGYVMDSRPGLYRHVLVLDFKSLYPSIIRTFKIDPLGLLAGLSGEGEEPPVAGFNGACFHRRRHILPGLLETLWQQRDRAKAAGNQPLSQAIKIIMNSFYGVLGSPQCRFFDQRLSGSITLRGHQILTESRDFIEQQGYRVIYGDTDSLFVWLNLEADGKEIALLGQSLARSLNDWWAERLQREFGVPSYLEVEYETHYQRFLMPTIRGSEKGSKKRYAGLVADDQGEPRLVFKGLESVRSDWTALAREFQQQLYWRIFNDQPYPDYIRETVRRLWAGELDGQLVYHKRLRQPLQDYSKSQPPHVRAARLLDQARKQQGLPPKYARGGRVAYLITTHGPEPVEACRSPIDYQHYLERQLAPVADGVLPFLGDSFEQLVGNQIRLF